MAGERFDDGFHRLAVLRASGEAAVEIDHVEVPRARLGEQQRLRRRVVAVYSGAIHVAFGQAHDLSLLEVDGGKDDHRRAVVRVILPCKGTAYCAPGDCEGTNATFGTWVIRHARSASPLATTKWSPASAIPVENTTLSRYIWFLSGSVSWGLASSSGS